MCKPHACQECGVTYKPRLMGSGFCSTPCRKAFHNRRAIRGAQLYDLFMALRNDREAASNARVWKFMCRLAADYREEDVKERAGRPSWVGLNYRDHVMQRLPYLQGEIFSIRPTRR